MHTLSSPIRYNPGAADGAQSGPACQNQGDPSQDHEALAVAALRTQPLLPPLRLALNHGCFKPRKEL